MRIGYFADGPWSHETIQKLLKDKNLSVTFICARFDKPDMVLKNIANNNNIPFLTNKNVNSLEFITLLDKFSCDLYVSMSFNQIFKSSIINHPPLGIINCHAGKLPFYRGRNVLNWALINDEKSFGITVHFINEEIDTGDIIIQQSYPISDDDDYSTLLSRSYIYCSELLYKAINNIRNGTATSYKQSKIHPLGFYCTQRKQGDEIMNWNNNSRDIFNFVRAISLPGPQATSYLAGKQIKINKVIEVKNAPKYKGIPGAIICKQKDSFFVKTQDTFIEVLEWSPKIKIKIGDRFS